VEDEEALEPGALVGQLANTVQNQVNDLLADGVVTTGVVVGRILLAGDQLLRVKQLAVSTGTNLICTQRNNLSVTLDTPELRWNLPARQRTTSTPTSRMKSLS